MVVADSIHTVRSEGEEMKFKIADNVDKYGRTFYL